MSDNIIKVAIHEDGIKVSFGLTTLQQWQFDMLTQCIKRNREAKKFEVIDILFDENDILHLSIRGVTKELIPAFIQMLQCETLVTITPTFEMVKLFDKYPK